MSAALPPGVSGLLTLALAVPVASVAPVAPLHGGAASASAPIPHSLVLVVAVLGLWAAIAAGVFAGDRLLARLGVTE